MSKKRVQIGSTNLGDKPHIVVAIDRQLPPDVISSLPNRGASLIEMRVDCFRDEMEKTMDYLHQVKELTGLPTIGTIRENQYTKSNRLQLFERIIPIVDAIDIEIDAAINKEVIEMASANTVIVSEHDFEKTPDTESLHEMVSTAMTQGADIFKIATTALNGDDVTRLLRFTQDAEAPVVTMAMGEIGTISRVVAPLFGSLFTYTYVVDSVAPGQIPLDEMASSIARFYPKGE